MIIRAKALLVAPINPGIHSKLDWPDPNEVKRAQKSTNKVPPKGFKKSEDGIRNIRDIIWISSDSDLLKLRIATAAHTGHGGHKGFKVTMDTTKAYFYCKGMGDDLKSFARTCIYCLSTETAKSITSPLRHALHLDRPNELLHFDFYYLSPAEI